MVTILIIALCLFLNGIFSAFEMAYVSIESDRLSDLADNNAKLRNLEQWKKNPERIFSIIQIGITFVAGLAAVVGGTKAAEFLVPILIRNYDFSSQLAHIFSILLIVLPLTYLNVVFGELLPKAIALRRPEKVLKLIHPVIVMMNKILSPIVTALENSTSFLLKLLSLSSRVGNQPPKQVHIENLEDFHQRYVLNLVGLKGKKNRDIVVPWERVIKINYGDSEKEVEEKITSSRHTRLPVTGDGEVVGLLHTKEFQSLPEDKSMPWQSIMRPILKLRPEEKVLKTFNDMQSTQNHMAVVEGDEEIPLGIITMENIIEQIMGDIEDEDDDDRMRRIIERKHRLQRGQFPRPHV